MKKIAFSLLSAAVITASAFAQERDTVAYAGVGIGTEHIENYDPGVMMYVMGGAPIKEIGPGTIAAEGEITYDLIKPERTWTYNYGGETVKYTYSVSLLTFGAYGAYIYDFNDKFFAKGRVGIMHRYLPEKKYNGHTVETSINDFVFAVGAQGGYKINNRFNVVLNFTDNGFTSDYHVFQISAGVQFNF